MMDFSCMCKDRGRIIWHIGYKWQGFGSGDLLGCPLCEVVWGDLCQSRFQPALQHTTAGWACGTSVKTHSKEGRKFWGEGNMGMTEQQGQSTMRCPVVEQAHPWRDCNLWGATVSSRMSSASSAGTPVVARPPILTRPKQLQLEVSSNTSQCGLRKSCLRARGRWASSWGRPGCWLWPAHHRWTEGPWPFWLPKSFLKVGRQ